MLIPHYIFKSLLGHKSQLRPYFLIKYYDHTPSKAESFIDTFLMNFHSRVDEDFIHQISSYKLSGLVHYTIVESESFDDANFILVKNGKNDPPAEALEYFKNNVDNPFNKYPYVKGKKE